MRKYLIIYFLFIFQFSIAQSYTQRQDSTVSNYTTKVKDKEINGDSSENLKARTKASSPPVVIGKNPLMEKVYYAIFFFGGLVLAMVFQFISRRSEVRGEVTYESKAKRQSVNLLEPANYSRRMDDLIKENDSLKVERARFKEQISKLTTEKEQTRSSDIPAEPLIKVIEEEPTVTAEWDIKAGNKDTEVLSEIYNSVLYFSTPSTTGEFRGGTPVFDEGASIYKFSLISANEANFEFCDNKSSVGLALNHRNEHILVAAEESNAFNPNASKIAIDGNQFGKAALEGTFWRLIRKAKIKYI